MMLKKALTHNLTSLVASRDILTARFKCHFLGKNSSTLRARKINNFYRRHSQILELCISNVIFSYYVEKIFAS